MIAIVDDSFSVRDRRLIIALLSILSMTSMNPKVEFASFGKLLFNGHSVTWLGIGHPSCISTLWVIRQKGKIAI